LAGRSTVHVHPLLPTNRGRERPGKEIVARAIHEFSDRAQKPFVPFNCAAITRDLLESQLFGHRRGAFTRADDDQLGLIRSAADGTILLDEVGELSLDLQPKLLRFLESGEIAAWGAVPVHCEGPRHRRIDHSNESNLYRDIGSIWRGRRPATPALGLPLHATSPCVIY
jgi:transcriptional regulator with AAA-type ATPase domain